MDRISTYDFYDNCIHHETKFLFNGKKNLLVELTNHPILYYFIYLFIYFCWVNFIIFLFCCDIVVDCETVSLASPF